MRQLLYRNVRARGLLQTLLVSAATSLLLVRLYLHLTGYPQVGGDTLHVAHVLWGGALMLVAQVITLSFIGKRTLQTAAVVGGAGFGIFIDEVGKFVTKDNNYFYEPAIGIIYAVFIVMFLSFNFLARKQVLTSREYQINALSQMEEAVARDMDDREKNRVALLLQSADQKHPLTRHLQRLVEKVATIPVPPPNRFTLAYQYLDRQYARFWRQKDSNRLVKAFFVAETLVFLSVSVALIAPNIQNLVQILDADAVRSLGLVVGELASLVAAAGFTIWGVVSLRKSRVYALEQFRRAALINIFLTNFFMFSRVEFEALPNFFFNLLLLGLVSYALRHEARSATMKK